MSLFTGAAIIGAALAAGTASTVAAKMSSNAASDAGDKASAANAADLAFQKEQAQNDYRNQETTRRANWDQHVAQQTANNKIRQAMGLAPVDIPAYVPSVDPAFTGNQPPPNSGSLGHVAGAPPPGPVAAPPPPARPTGASLQPQMQPINGGFAGGMSLGSMAGAPIQVRGRDGQLLTFPTQQQADVYKQQQGIV